MCEAAFEVAEGSNCRCCCSWTRRRRRAAKQDVLDPEEPSLEEAYSRQRRLVECIIHHMNGQSGVCWFQCRVLMSQAPMPGLKHAVLILQGCVRILS